MIHAITRYIADSTAKAVVGSLCLVAAIEAVQSLYIWRDMRRRARP